MTKISQYSTDVNITGNDKWIGSDAQNFLITKNFTPNNLASFFNENNVIDIGASIRYRYQTLLPGEAREQGTISFETEIGPQVNFSAITTFLIAKNTLKGNTVTQYLDFLVDSKVLLSRANNINIFGYYKITSLEPWIPNTNFFVVEVDFLAGNGFIYEDLDYLVSLVDKVQDIPPPVWGSITGDIEDQTDLIDYISSQITTPTLQQVTTAGAITTDVITVGGITSGNLYSDGYNFGISDNYDANYNLLYQPYSGLQITDTINYVYLYQDASIGFQTAVGDGNLRSDLLTGTRSWQFPDASGTLALTSDIQILTPGQNITIVSNAIDVDIPPIVNTSAILGTTGTNPRSITIDSSGNIYVANVSLNNVTKITPTGVSTTLGTTGGSPFDITIDSLGNVYTANITSNNVTKITSLGVSTIFGTTGSNPFNITIDSSGNIYTSNSASNNVTKITPLGVSSILGTTGSSPYGIVVDSLGNVYTANNGSNNVSKITPAGVSTILGTTGSSPEGITIDSLGNVYTTNSVSNNVTKITPLGVSSIFASTGSFPVGITIDSSDNVYTSNVNSDNVTKITSLGVSTILGTTGDAPADIVIDSSGNVYTVNSNSNNVTKITVDNKRILAVDDNLNIIRVDVSGGITSVTATSPITSSGGATPDISTSMATNKLIGRSTAGTGVMEEITIGTGLTLSGGILNGSATGVTSVGLTMPSAFTVTNSPITSSGDIAVTGAGLVSQYVRGDGTLANFPNSTGGGSSVNYYLNGSVSQGTFGGTTYYQMSKTPILGAGTNFIRTNGAGNGYIASFITDAGDPSQLNIPGGNWNVEFYFNASSGGGSPSFYAELYKVSATNVFTLIASDSLNPEGITNGTTVDQYFTSIPVPQTSLLVTDRLAVRIFVNTGGRTITLHTENGNLSEVLTTFTTGLTALNELTQQVQYFAVGTGATNFNISSSGDTHTFNLLFNIRRNANNSSNNNINYNGYAVTGSAESSAVWTITRLTIAASGSITVATATNVAWTNRESATYT